MRAKGLTPAFVGTDKLDGPDWLAAAEGQYFTSFPDVKLLPSKYVSNVVRGFISKYGDFKSTFGPPTFVAVQVAAAAIKTACKDGRATRAEVLAATQKTDLQTTVLGYGIRFRGGDSVKAASTSTRSPAASVTSCSRCGSTAEVRSEHARARVRRDCRAPRGVLHPQGRRRRGRATQARCRTGSATASPIFERLVYINSCSQGALSDSVRQSYADYLRDWDDRGSPWEYWVEQTERARASFAGLVNAAPDEIAVTSSISEGVSAVATGLRYGGRRNKIVLTDYEFPTVGQIFHAQESRGARVVHVPAAADGTIPIEGFERAIDDETLLVGLPQVSYRTGTMLDVERDHAAGARARRARAGRRVPGRRLGADRRQGARRRRARRGALKYLLGSAGLAFLYCRRERSSASGRRRRAGSRTRTSSRWITATTRRRPLRRASSRARRRCRRSTRASPGSS